MLSFVPWSFGRLQKVTDRSCEAAAASVMASSSANNDDDADDAINTFLAAPKVGRPRRCRVTGVCTPSVKKNPSPSCSKKAAAAAAAKNTSKIVFDMIATADVKNGARTRMGSRRWFTFL
jgi:hypothetical protein